MQRKMKQIWLDVVVSYPFGLTLFRPWPEVTAEYAYILIKRKIYEFFFGILGMSIVQIPLACVAHGPIAPNNFAFLPHSAVAVLLLLKTWAGQQWTRYVYAYMSDERSIRLNRVRSYYIISPSLNTNLYSLHEARFK